MELAISLRGGRPGDPKSMRGGSASSGTRMDDGCAPERLWHFLPWWAQGETRGLARRSVAGMEHRCRGILELPDFSPRRAHTQDLDRLRREHVGDHEIRPRDRATPDRLERRPQSLLIGRAGHRSALVRKSPKLSSRVGFSRRTRTRPPAPREYIQSRSEHTQARSGPHASRSPGYTGTPPRT